MKILLYVSVFFLVIAISLGCYFLQRKVNYALSYKSLVKSTIMEMVKPECLVGKP